MANTLRPSRWKKLRELAVWLVLPLALGIALSLLMPRPVVGLIYLDQEIFPETADNIIAQIVYARQRPEVRAVVLVVNSPGGTVVDTEAVYQELERLRLTKPVLASVEELAASGAYYLTAGTDYVYAKPSSMVGNIGAIDVLPPPPMVFESVVATGPYKEWGAPSDTIVRELDVSKQGFSEAVKLGRGGALQAGPEVLLRGEVWSGHEALRLGLVDELGSRSQAIERAARMAHIFHYNVADLRVRAGLPKVSTALFYRQNSDGTRSPYPSQPGLYLLYIPPDDGRLP